MADEERKQLINSNSSSVTRKSDCPCEDKRLSLTIKEKFKRIFNFPKGLNRILQNVVDIRASVDSSVSREYYFSGKIFQNRYHLLQFAAEKDHFELVHVLLNSYDISKVNLLNSQQVNSVYIASEFGAVLFLQRWADNGYPLNITNDRGQSPLHYAANKLRYERTLHSIKFLFDNGADPNVICNYNGQTAFEYLINTYKSDNLCQKAIIEFIRSGANVNRQNRLNGETFLFPLHYGYLFDFLVHGADVNIENHEGYTALDSIYKALQEKNYLSGLQERSVTATNLYLWVRAMTLIFHIERMEILQLPVNKKVISTIQSLRPFLMYVEEMVEENINVETEIKYKVELQKLKDTRLDDRTSMYDIIFKSTKEMSRLVRKPVFQEYFKSKKHRKDFQQFWYFLQNKYNSGVIRNLILEHAKDCLKFLVAHLPEVCLDKILDSFNNFEMMELIRNVPISNSCDQINVSLILRNCSDLVYT